jgi:hypothetical protein
MTAVRFRGLTDYPFFALEPAVHLVRAIEGDHQIRPAVFRDRVTLLPCDERRVLMPGKASADPGRLQVDLIHDPARRGHTDRLHELQDPPVVAEQGDLLAGGRRKRDLSQRSGHDRGLTSVAARGLHLVPRAVDLGVGLEVRTLRRQLVGRRAKGSDLSRCEEARNQRPPIAVEPFANHRCTESGMR